MSKYHVRQFASVESVCDAIVYASCCVCHTDVNILRDMSTGPIKPNRLTELIATQKNLLKYVLQCEYSTNCYSLIHSWLAVS